MCKKGFIVKNASFNDFTFCFPFLLSVSISDRGTVCADPGSSWDGVYFLLFLLSSLAPGSAEARAVLLTRGLHGSLSCPPTMGAPSYPHNCAQGLARVEASLSIT